VGTVKREEIEDRRAFERRDSQLGTIATFLTGVAFGLAWAWVFVWLAS
jgi:tetrahydromethanopterin S-methyltransferase subunit F